MATERGLHGVVAQTCKVRALQQVNTGGAMAWALQSGDYSL